MTDTNIDLTVKQEWIFVKEYHPNVTKYYWNTMLRNVAVRVKEIAYIECEGYVKPPLGKKWSCELKTLKWINVLMDNGVLKCSSRDR